MIMIILIIIIVIIIMIIIIIVAEIDAAVRLPLWLATSSPRC